MRTLLNPPFLHKQPDLLIIAGEHSGDEHAAHLATEFLSHTPGSHVVAIGGQRLKQAGAELLFDLTRHSVLGFVDVIKNYSFFKQLLSEILAYIQQYQPKKICFIDYPGLNLRIAQKLFELGLSKKGGGPISLYFYISPQIWAWKAKRRFKMAKWLDSVGVIFPFEVECYKDTHLPTHFLGHPFLATDFKNPFTYNPNGHVLLLPGSRKDPVKAILPILLNAWKHHHQQFPQDKPLICAPSEEIASLVKSILQKHAAAHIPIQITRETPIFAKAAYASSGTVSLLTLLAGIPGVLVYKTHPITFALGRYFVKLDRLGIANILLNEFVYPEFIQSDAVGTKIAHGLANILNSPERLQHFHSLVAKTKKLLSQPPDISLGSWISS